MAKNKVAADELRLLIERYERLQEEKENIAADQKDVIAEAKARGFDTRAMREIIRLRKLSPAERREREAMVDTYRAALGMLDGTPLGKWAVERLKKDDKKPEDPEGGAGEAAGEAEEAEPAQDLPPPPPEPSVAEARHLGSDAAKAGASVTSNPFPAFDERRAAWDEAWCSALGTDGMDIPDALKRKDKPKKGDVPDGPQDGEA
jgi:uncharacterized protein (UPF0335 family)